MTVTNKSSHDLSHTLYKRVHVPGKHSVNSIKIIKILIDTVAFAARFYVAVPEKNMRYLLAWSVHREILSPGEKVWVFFKIKKKKKKKKGDTVGDVAMFEGNLKGPYADHILIRQGSTGSSTFFWYQMKAHIFLVANPKFLALNSL